jgi:alpha-glucuronidase
MISGKLFFAVVLATSFAAVAQTADQAWLAYRPLSTPHHVPLRVLKLGNSPVENSAAAELTRGLQGIFGSSVRDSKLPRGSIVLGTYEEFRRRFPQWTPTAQVGQQYLSIHDDLSHQVPLEVIRQFTPVAGNFMVFRDAELESESIFIAAPTDRGVLYGAFALLRVLAEGGDLPANGFNESPAMPVRWVDEWDNPDGSIERGYGGRSIFFDGSNVRQDLAPVAEYARLLASIGINGCNVNNVNAAAQLLDSNHIKQLARVADAMRPWGVHLAMSVAIASPQTIGGLSTYDPLDPAVKAWWTAKVNEIYALIPDFAGFTVKADSEGQPGPASYGRTPADAANLLANALEPHGGVVLYRAFVYNHHADWNDPKADRARAAYDIFHPLDGKFAANVIVQTKEGPIDFQAREPVSPLFAGLEQTSQAMELQVTQEYTGQQRHLVYLAPMWKQVLDFDLRADGKATPVKEILAGKSFHRPLGGMIGVAGVGQNGWLGSPLAVANLYAFGRLAWNPELTPEEIAGEWTRQTISSDPEVVATVDKMLMQSWPAYEHYTGPLGTQTLTDITGSHYGPNIESSENNGWGQWHRDDHLGIGMDRSVATGTGYAGQYPPEVAKVYESLETTPDNLLLFFHHVPYTYELHDGKTVIQYIYDSHYQGAAEAAELGTEWAKLKSHIDDKLYEDVRARIEYQAGHAIVWRDSIVQYFLKQSGIPDEQGRAGHYPGRLEAEDARLTGYKIIDITPWEDASAGKAVICGDLPPITFRPGAPNSMPPSAAANPAASETAPHNPCSAEWTYAGPAGRFNIAVQYFDLPGGVAHFTLSINGHPAADWSADATLPSRRPNGDNSTRHTIRDVELKPGDVLSVEGTPDRNDPAALDYIEILPGIAVP